MPISYAHESFVDLLGDVTVLLDRTAGRVVVGLCGPPGAGKSTAALGLAAAFQDAAYLPMDGFHLSNAALDRLGRRDRKGAIDTFDAAGYVATLRRVRAEYRERDVYVPAFDRELDEAVAAGHVVAAECRLVITEGNYLGVPDGEWSAVRGLLDRLYYVDCPARVRRERLVARHIDGGRSPQAAQAWADEVDEPNAQLIATTREACDRVL
ncbi:nucleoside/nucleotide kinase family protein [Mycolicibacterium sp. Dal123E01]|uniref:nucleoside/nucleotide kinase family protein n=1 Tax=Mycolicibacterium sp. Dal123E01 TaxID=3457578 RepID=UPI00403E6918